MTRPMFLLAKCPETDTQFHELVPNLACIITTTLKSWMKQGISSQTRDQRHSQLTDNSPITSMKSLGILSYQNVGFSGHLHN